MLMSSHTEEPISHETYLPTEQPSPQEDARIPGTDEHTRWSPGPQPATGKRSPSSDCIRVETGDGGQTRYMSPEDDRCLPPPTGSETVGEPNTARTLTRQERIRRSHEFLHIQQGGVRTRGRYMTLIGLPNTRTLSRLGIVAPRRLGKAVRRNQSKRRVREFFRHNKPVAGLDLVVLPRREFLDTPFAILLDDYRRTLRRQVRAHSAS